MHKKHLTGTHLKSETGTIQKDWAGKISVALTYPNYYHVGMSNLGFQTVYRLMNDLADVVCERVFLPAKAGRPDGRLRSLESNRQLADFDIIAFSISFENDYPSLLAILAEAGIPLWSAARHPSHPLIMAGGVTSFLNPEPIAPFVDCFLIGEAEPVLPHFFDIYKGHDGPRQALLEALAIHVPGTYVPALYDVGYQPDGTLAYFQPKGDSPVKVGRVMVQDLSASHTCSAIVTPHTTFDDTYLVEASRGCPHGCRFCAAGFVYRPPRHRTRAQLEKAFEAGRQWTKKIGVIAAAVPDIPHIETLCRKALDQHVTLSFSSLRADRLTQDFLDVLGQAGIKTATIAPDAGSERMRRVINKGVEEQDVLRAAALLVQAGIPNLKLYFMVGLPTETISDVEAIVTFCKRIKHQFLKVSRTTQKLGQIIVSLNAFVPKPFTPFQWVPLEDVKTLKARIKQVKHGLKGVANVRVHADVPRWAYIQALLSRGDRRTATLLVAAHKNNGNWPKTLKEAILNPDFYTYRERSLDEILPWDFIDHGISKTFLKEEYQKALQGKTTPPLPGGAM